MQNVQGARGLLRRVCSRAEDGVGHVVNGDEVQHVLGVAVDQLNYADLDRVNESATS